MRVLQVIESAYRATLEEQDDTVIWFTRAIRAAGADADILLMGTAVSYAVRGQSAHGLTIGEWSQVHPPAIEAELAKLIESGASVSAVEEDLVERGITQELISPGIKLLSRKARSRFFASYDAVWKW